MFTPQIEGSAGRCGLQTHRSHLIYPPPRLICVSVPNRSSWCLASFPLKDTHFPMDGLRSDVTDVSPGPVSEAGAWTCCTSRSDKINSPLYLPWCSHTFALNIQRNRKTTFRVFIWALIVWLTNQTPSVFRSHSFSLFYSATYIWSLLQTSVDRVSFYTLNTCGQPVSLYSVQKKFKKCHFLSLTETDSIARVVENKLRNKQTLCQKIRFADYWWQDFSWMCWICICIDENWFWHWLKAPY